MARAALVLLLLLGAVACGPPRAITPAEVAGACRFAGQTSQEAGGCQFQDAFCQRIEAAVAADHESKAACIAACRDAARPFLRFSYGYDCTTMFPATTSWCTRYCRTNYPEYP